MLNKLPTKGIKIQPHTHRQQHPSEEIEIQYLKRDAKSSQDRRSGDRHQEIETSGTPHRTESIRRMKKRSQTTPTRARTKHAKQPSNNTKSRINIIRPRCTFSPKQTNKDKNNKWMNTRVIRQPEPAIAEVTRRDSSCNTKQVRKQQKDGRICDGTADTIAYEAATTSIRRTPTRRPSTIPRRGTPRRIREKNVA